MDPMPHSCPQPKYPVPLTAENIQLIFSDAGDFNKRQIYVGPDRQEVWIFSVDGLVASGDIADFVMKPLLTATESLTAESAEKLLIYCTVASPIPDMDTLVSRLVNGFCVVLLGENQAVAFETKTPEKRSVSAPTVENTVKGAKDAFTETIRTNTSLLRRHLRSPELRLSQQVVGRRSLTNVTVCSIAGITNPEAVKATEQRLRGIDIDGLMTPAAVEEYLTGSRETAFPLLIYTERADRFAWGLLSGRVGVLVDGLPLGYLLPCGFSDFLKSPEDRNGNYLVSSAIKLLRYLSLLLSLLLPGLFAAVSLYHQEMIPTALLEAVVESRNAVPFTVGAEVLILLIAFELLQEAGLHLPQNLGQAVSIIGGLVVGSAAVEAKLISPTALIAVAAAGICGYSLPQRDFADALRLWRFLIALGGLGAGFAGVTLMGLFLLVHLDGLKSLGIPYLRAEKPLLRPRLKEVPWRDLLLGPTDRRNQT